MSSKVGGVGRIDLYHYGASSKEGNLFCSGVLEFMIQRLFVRKAALWQLYQTKAKGAGTRLRKIK
jgi:hypothetical protein